MSWLEAYKHSGEKLRELYHPKAYIWTPKDFLQSDTAVCNAWISARWNIQRMDTLFTLSAHAKGVRYGIYEFQTLENGSFCLLTIQQESQIVFDLLISKSHLQSNETNRIDEARAQWMTFCNHQRVDELIENLYCEDAIYFNQKPILQGRSAIRQEYSYMTSANYSLELTPLFIEQINEEYAIEIGQCSGSYGGKYVLVWEKQVDGQWQICFDSNV